MTRARSCTCDNYRPGEPFTRGRDCGRCWRWHNDPVYRDGRTVAGPCVHLGDLVGGIERERLSLDHRREWRRCELGLSTGGSPPGFVCSCLGCGRSCPGYESSET